MNWKLLDTYPFFLYFAFHPLVFFATQSLYYLLIRKSDPLHHLAAAFWLFYKLFDHSDFRVNAFCLVLAEILNGLLLCNNWLPKYISRLLSVFVRIFVHPCVIYYYISTRVDRVSHLFFLAIAIQKIYQFLILRRTNMLKSSKSILSIPKVCTS